MDRIRKKCCACCTCQRCSPPTSDEDKQPYSKAPHYLTILPRQLDAEMGQSLSMEVQVVGFPVPEVRWFRNNKEITDGGRYTLTFGIDGRAVCTINTLQYGDSGNFKVKAKNPFGTSINATKLTVRLSKEMRRKLKNKMEKEMKAKLQSEQNLN